VQVSAELMEYMARIVRATRTATSVVLGAGPRATLTLVKTAQALAVFDGLEMVVPDHIKELLVPVIAHRMVIDSRARFSGTTAASIVLDLLEELPLPG
jgi:MoxR-like ATPase